MENSFREKLERDPKLKESIERSTALWKRQRELRAKLTQEEWEELARIERELAEIGRSVERPHPLYG